MMISCSKCVLLKPLHLAVADKEAFSSANGEVAHLELIGEETRQFEDLYRYYTGILSHSSCFVNMQVMR